MNTATVTVCLLDTATLCVTVTDAHNCTASSCVTVYGEDVRCFSGNTDIQKVEMCHNGNLICVSANSVDVHLAQGDNFCDKNVPRFLPETGEINSKLTVFPNPFTDVIKIHGLSPNSTIQVSDIAGKILMSKKLNADGTIKVDGLPRGVYILKTEKGFRKIVKMN
jgi:Secretion system C-terminal sorting domain